jgi:hypothetical protein
MEEVLSIIDPMIVVGELMIGEPSQIFSRCSRSRRSGLVATLSWDRVVDLGHTSLPQASQRSRGLRANISSFGVWLFAGLAARRLDDIRQLRAWSRARDRAARCDQQNFAVLDPPVAGAAARFFPDML